MTARFLVGDVFDQLATLDDNSVDLVLSSPPFLALRSYLPADDPNKAKEIGSEATPADYLDTLLDVVEACARVLAPHGSLVFELGDTYSGTGGAGGDWTDSPATTKARVPGGSNGGPPRRVLSGAWPLAKSLCGIPTLFAWSLAYGRNLLRPERTTGAVAARLGVTPDEWFLNPGERNSFAFGNGRVCCNKPVGCMMTHRGCKWLKHPWKRTIVFQDKDAPCSASGVRDDPETGERVALSCDLIGPHTVHRTVERRTGVDYRGCPV